MFRRYFIYPWFHQGRCMTVACLLSCWSSVPGQVARGPSEWACPFEGAVLEVLTGKRNTEPMGDPRKSVPAPPSSNVQSSQGRSVEGRTPDPK